MFFACLSVVGWGFSVVYCDIPSAAIRAFETYGSDRLYLSRVLSDDSKIESANANVNFDDNDAKSIEDSFQNNKFDKIYDFRIGNLGFRSVESIRYYDCSDLNGCVVADASFLVRYGLSLVDGRLPKTETEIAIPKYFFELYQYYGYSGITGNRISIETIKDLGKVELNLTDVFQQQISVSIVGVVDTGFRAEDWELLKTKKADVSEGDWNEYQKLSNRFDDYMRGGLQQSAFVTPEFIERFVNGFQAEIRVLDATGILAYAQRGRAVPYSEAAANKNLIRISEGESLTSGQCFAPLAYYEQKYYMSEDTLAEQIRAGLNLSIKLGSKENNQTYQVVGYFKDGFQGDFVIADSEYADAAEEKVNRTISTLLTKLSDDKNENKKLVSLGLSSYDEDYDYTLNGLAGSAAKQMKSVKAATSKYVPLFGAAVLVFSALMMFNFISATIAAKKKEIGALRAIGTKNSAVFGIFAAESIFTAFTAFLASIAGSVLLVYAFNLSMNLAGGYVWFLTYSIAESVTSFLIGSAIALLGSLIPIIRLLRKKPMEILR